MNYTLRSDELLVSISARGAEIQSVRDKDGTEYIWQGNPVYWAERAINIFPNIGTFTKDTYTFQGKEYHLNLHGFVWYSELEAFDISERAVSFRMRDNRETKKQYPFSFVVTIRYTLEKNDIHICFEVENTDVHTMYFGFGGHPGFLLPMESGLTFTDYMLEFDAPCQPLRIGITDQGFVSGEKTPFELQEGRKLHLKHELFDKDAIVLQGIAGDRVTLKSEKGNKSVSVYYPKVKYLGLWKTPRTKASFLCIEALSALPARQDVIEEISSFADYTALEPGNIYTYSWSMAIDPGK